MPTANYYTTPQTDYPTGYGDDEENKTTPGVVTPQPVTNFNPAYGGKPSVPDPSAVLQNVIGANLGMMPDIKGLGKKASKYFWNQTVGRVPGYEDMAAQSAKNIGSFLRGEVPEDVLYQLGRGAAERGIMRGGGFSNADYLRSLGLTSLGLMGEGEKGLTGALQRAESVPLFDISKYMLSPQDAFNAQFQANVLAAAPNPAAAAAAAKSAVTGGVGKTTPGFTVSPPALGGGAPKTTPGYDWYAWSLANTVPSGTGPPSFTYDRFAGAPGEDLAFEGGLPAGYLDPFRNTGGETYVDWNDPYLQDLLGGGEGGGGMGETANEFLGGWDYGD